MRGSGWVVYGGWQFARQQFNAAEAILIATVPSSATCILADENAGTTCLLRAQIVMFFFLFTAVAVNVRKRKHAPHRSTHGPAA